jgi:hypothetical protein
MQERLRRTQPLVGNKASELVRQIQSLIATIEQN